jgi:hypothetical protein
MMGEGEAYVYNKQIIKQKKKVHTLNFTIFKNNYL